jgi:hypothetical protein
MHRAATFTCDSRQPVCSITIAPIGQLQAPGSHPARKPSGREMTVNKDAVLATANTRTCSYSLIAPIAGPPIDGCAEDTNQGRDAGAKIARPAVRLTWLFTALPARP